MYSVQADVPRQRIADLMTSAIEGGSNYWLEAVKPVYNNHSEYSEAEAYNVETMIGRTFVSDGNGEAVLDAQAIQKGLNLLGSVAGGRHLAAFLSENDDAETADVFLQLCLFGEVVFG